MGTPIHVVEIRRPFPLPGVKTSLRRSQEQGAVVLTRSRGPEPGAGGRSQEQGADDPDKEQGPEPGAGGR